MLSLLDALIKPQSDLHFNYKDISLSIRQHLTYLLNSRRGVLAHLPDYGLPDVADIYQGIPYSMSYLFKTIATTIEKYEPRLRNVTVTQRQTCNKDCVLQLEIKAEMQQYQHIVFETYLMSAGTIILE